VHFVLVVLCLGVAVLVVGTGDRRSRRA